MALTDAIGKVFERRFMDNFYQNNVWYAVARDFSSSLSYGDNLELSFSEHDAVVNKRNKANAQSGAVADHRRGDPHVANLRTVTLNISQYTDIDELIPYTPNSQSAVPVASRVAAEAAIKSIEIVNNDIKDKVNAYTGTDANLDPVVVKTGDWDTEAHRNAIDAKIRQAGVALDNKFVPAQGRMMITSADVFDQIRELVIEKRLLLVGGATDRALLDSEVLMYRGFTIVKDLSAGSGTTATDDAKHTMYFTRAADAIAFASQLRLMKMIDSEMFRGQRILGQHNYGIEVYDPRKIIIVKHTINT